MNVEAKPVCPCIVEVSEQLKLVLEREDELMEALSDVALFVIGILLGMFINMAFRVWR